MNNHYNKNLKSFARNLRNDSTKAEIHLWCELLRGSQMMGYPFLRQRPVENFIADFMQKELTLVIEVDGNTHSFEEVCAKDSLKDERLRELGFTVLRFEDEDVMNHIDSVQMKIEETIKSLRASSPKQRARLTHPPSHTCLPARKGDIKTAKLTTPK